MRTATEAQIVNAPISGCGLRESGPRERALLSYAWAATEPPGAAARSSYDARSRQVPAPCAAQQSPAARCCGGCAQPHCEARDTDRQACRGFAAWPWRLRMHFACILHAPASECKNTCFAAITVVSARRRAAVTEHSVP